MSRISNVVYAAIAAALGTGCTTTTIATDDPGRAATVTDRTTPAVNTTGDDY